MPDNSRCAMSDNHEPADHHTWRQCVQTACSPPAYFPYEIEQPHPCVQSMVVDCRTLAQIACAIQDMWIAPMQNDQRRGSMIVSRRMLAPAVQHLRRFRSG